MCRAPYAALWSTSQLQRVLLQVHTLITAISVEVWAVGQLAAYRLHLPRLYSRTVHDKAQVKVNSSRQKVYLLLHKVSDRPWPFLRG